MGFREIGGAFLGAVILAFGAVLLFRFLWARETRVRSLAINFSLMLFSFIFIALFLESLLFVFFVRSQEFGYTLSGTRWFHKYWNPINSHGYRDPEYQEEDFLEKGVVLVVGDSFVAGYGINDYRDRFSNVLQTLLPNSIVLNIAKNGWGTVEEIEAIQAYPVSPDLIILTYFINDIQNTAERSGLLFTPPPPPEVLDKPIINRIKDKSHVLNYMYWSLYKITNQNIGSSYWDYLSASYSDPNIWGQHERELTDVIAYSRKNGIRLIVLIFPDLRRVSESQVFTQRVANVMKEHQVEVIDLSIHLAGRHPDTLIVHDNDAHPNVELHREVAELLFVQIMKPVPETSGS